MFVILPLRGVVKLTSIQKFELWTSHPYFDQDTQGELLALKNEPKEIEERFYKDLEFGTGGLRGIIGAGTNRMNFYTVRKASQGLAQYIVENGERAQKSGIVIAYDSRRFSKDFAKQAAMVFCQNGIQTFLFDDLRTTPELSYAVRHLRAAAGVVITASHNPKEYNGYKVYGEDGSQISLDVAEHVLRKMSSITDITTVHCMNEEEALQKGLLNFIGKEIDDAYIKSLKTLITNPKTIEVMGENLRIVFTPIHGSANMAVQRILGEAGFSKVYAVKEQEEPDGEFPTVEYPNPEEKAVFSLAIDLAKKVDADIILGTDPDGDRMGVLVKDGSGGYVALTGNQTGCLILEYLLTARHQKGLYGENDFVVKTIVTTKMAQKIANFNQVNIQDVLTGFKFIGEQILLRQERGDEHFVFGFEESYGYLAGSYSRDKDAVLACLLFAELAAFAKEKGLSCYELLGSLYEKYGYFQEDMSTFTLKGKEGVEKIGAIMHALREKPLMKVADFEVISFKDYKTSEQVHLKTGSRSKLDLPVSDVLYYELSGDDWVCVRPSGTEPKLKIYFGVSDTCADAAKHKITRLKENFLSLLEGMLG